MIVTLNKRSFKLKEPCLRDFKIILDVFTQPITADGLQVILDIFTLNSVPLAKVRTDEFELFFNAVKQLCKLTDDKKQGVSKPIDWGSVYAHLSASFGWTYDEIDTTMTMSRLDEYHLYMNHNPPVHQLVAADIGYEYKEQQSGNAFLKQCANRARLGTNE